MAFRSEKQMSLLMKEYLIAQLEAHNYEILEEFEGLFGIPDFLLVKRKENTINLVIALELKLRNWTRALEQAFKYKTFSHRSVVVIDESHIQNVKKNLGLFEHYRIGLASFNEAKQFDVYYCPDRSTPYSDYIFNLLTKKLSKTKEPEQNKEKKILKTSKPNQLHIPLAQLTC